MGPFCTRFCIAMLSACLSFCLSVCLSVPTPYSIVETCGKFKFGGIVPSGTFVFRSRCQESRSLDHTEPRHIVACNPIV